MEVNVVNNQVEQAMQRLKILLIKEGMLKELKKRRYYAKPSVKAKLKREEAEKSRFNSLQCCLTCFVYSINRA